MAIDVNGYTLLQDPSDLTGMEQSADAFPQVSNLTDALISMGMAPATADALPLLPTLNQQSQDVSSNQQTPPPQEPWYSPDYGPDAGATLGNAIMDIGNPLAKGALKGVAAIPNLFNELINYDLGQKPAFSINSSIDSLVNAASGGYDPTTQGSQDSRNMANLIEPAASVMGGVSLGNSLSTGAVFPALGKLLNWEPGLQLAAGEGGRAASEIAQQDYGVSPKNASYIDAGSQLLGLLGTGLAKGTAKIFASSEHDAAQALQDVYDTAGTSLPESPHAYGEEMTDAVTAPTEKALQDAEATAAQGVERDPLTHVQNVQDEAATTLASDKSAMKAEYDKLPADEEAPTVPWSPVRDDVGSIENELFPTGATDKSARLSQTIAKLGDNSVAETTIPGAREQLQKVGALPPDEASLREWMAARSQASALSTLPGRDGNFGAQVVAALDKHGQAALGPLFDQTATARAAAVPYYQKLNGVTGQVAHANLMDIPGYLESAAPEDLLNQAPGVVEGAKNQHLNNLLDLPPEARANYLAKNQIQLRQLFGQDGYQMLKDTAVSAPKGSLEAALGGSVAPENAVDNMLSSVQKTKEAVTALGEEGLPQLQSQVLGRATSSGQPGTWANDHLEQLKTVFPDNWGDVVTSLKRGGSDFSNLISGGYKLSDVLKAKGTGMGLGYIISHPFMGGSLGTTTGFFRNQAMAGMAKNFAQELAAGDSSGLLDALSHTTPAGYTGAGAPLAAMRGEANVQGAKSAPMTLEQFTAMRRAQGVPAGRPMTLQEFTAARSQQAMVTQPSGYQMSYPEQVAAIWPNMEKVESGGKADATSDVGAMGVGQIMPKTWAEWAPKVGVDPSNPYDAAANTKVAQAYFDSLMEQFNGDTKMALAAYNWGPGRVEATGAQTYAELLPILKAKGLTSGKNNVVGYVKSIAG